MSLIEVLLIVTVCLLVGILFAVRAILRLLYDDRQVGHVNAIYQINEALLRLAGHDGDNLVPQMLQSMETLEGLLSDIEVSTAELRHAPWRKSRYEDER